MKVVQTVLGPIAPERLGRTLIHEHLLFSLEVYFLPPEAVEARLADSPVNLDTLWWVRANIMSNRDNLTVSDPGLVLLDIERFRDAGGGSIVEVSSHGLKRDVAGLKMISATTGVPIVAGCGYYIGDSHPETLADRSIESIREELVRELTSEIDGTGVVAGVIGEIGTSTPITPIEERVVAAAVSAQRATQAAIIIHPGTGSDAVFTLADHIERLGGDPSRVVLSHLDERLRNDLSGFRRLADRGFVLGFDTFGREAYYRSRDRQLPSDADRIATLVRLLDAGYVDSVTLAQDICYKCELTAFGGHGYSHLLRNILPRLRRLGVTDDLIDTMMIANPRRLLTRDMVGQP